MLLLLIEEEEGEVEKERGWSSSFVDEPQVTEEQGLRLLLELFFPTMVESW